MVAFVVLFVLPNYTAIVFEIVYFQPTNRLMVLSAIVQFEFHEQFTAHKKIFGKINNQLMNF